MTALNLPPTAAPFNTVDQVARTAYGRLVAVLAKRTGDIAAAEDAIADAFSRALVRWPEDGIPSNPEGWLLTVAHNRENDRLRSSAHKTSLAGDTLEDMERRSDAAIAKTMQTLTTDSLPDERLKLMFVCAHPAIDETIRTPLMLQTVLGLEAADIAAAFAVPTSTMAQRLVRAKRKIKQAGIPFEVPDRDALDERLEYVLEAIYGAYASQWLLSDNPDTENARDLCDEALFLSDLLVECMPDHAEALGLASLLWFIRSRSAVRVSVDGELVPISVQDCAGWDRLALARGHALLNRASAFGQIGRFQLEAAIQCVHADRKRTGETDWPAIVQLYQGLLSQVPTLGAAVAHAAAVGEAFGPQAGLNALDRLDQDALLTFQPAWATRAHLLSQGASDSATLAAFEGAIALTRDPATRAYLTRKAKKCKPT